MRKKIIIIFSVILFVVISIFAYNFIMRNVLYNIDHEEIVFKYSKQYNVDPMLMFAIIKNESNFNTDIKSHRHAIGLMQIIESTASEMAEKIGINDVDLTDAETNINIGIKYFSELEAKYDGNYLLALAAYNAGQGNVDNWIERGIIGKDGSNIENIPFQETNMYVRRVSRDYKIYTKLYGKKYNCL